MEVTPTNINLFFTTLAVQYNLAKQLAPVVAPKISTTYPVSSEIFANAWTGMTAKLREWVGARYVETPAPQVYQVAMQLFEKTAGISRRKFEDDLYGVYSLVAADFGKQSAKWPDFQIRDLLQNQGSQTGSRQFGTDNLSHWNTAHPVDFWDASKGTFPNDYTGGAVSVNGSVIGGQLTVQGLSTVLLDASRRKNESVEAGGFAPDLLTTGALMKLTAMSLLQAQFLGVPVIGQMGLGNVPTAGSPVPTNAPMVGNSENLLRGLMDYVCWLDLGGSAAVGNTTMDYVWYSLCTSQGIKPFSWLLRNEPGFVSRTNINDPVVFDTGMFLFGTDEARGAPAWSLPTLSSRSSA